LVDDSPTVRNAIRFHLIAFGCRNFIEASDGAQALELARKEHPNLIMLDLMMPESGGITSQEVFEKLRTELPDAAIVIVSSIPHENVKSDYMKSGATAYIVKPFTKFSFEQARHRLRRIFEEFR
jgi:two-component system, chemotaxis family, chemotaxis protein CheY